MQSSSHRYEPEAYALLRIGSGLLFALHGMYRLSAGQPLFEPQPGSQLWVMGTIELAGGLTVMAGFKTRLAALVCVATTTLTYFRFQPNTATADGIFSTMSRGEMPLLYILVFLSIAARGAGKWSIENGIGKH